MMGGHRNSLSVAPCQGLFSFWLVYPEFRYAPLRALVPAHAPRADAGFGGDHALAPDARQQRATGVVSAPEARRNTARSAAQRNSGKLSSREFANPWQGVTENRIALKVTLIKRQPMRLQESLELLEERNASMMFFLRLDVPMNLGALRLAHGERAISFLPFESRGLLEYSRNPTRGVRLQLTDDLRDGLVLAQLRQDVNVVGCSIDDQRDSSFIANRAAEILMDPRANFRRQPGFAPLRRKDDVIQQVAMGGTHADAGFRRPFQGLGSFWIIPGVPLRSTPGFNSAAPSGCCRGSVRMRSLRRSEGIQPPRFRRTMRVLRGLAANTISAGGAKEYSPECSEAKLRGPIHQILQPCQGVTEHRSDKASK